MIGLLKFILSAQFIIGLVIGGAGMFIYLNWQNKAVKKG